MAAGKRRIWCFPVRSLADRGFSLLEVLIALVIAALALGVLYSAGLTGLISTQTASRYEQASARARSHLTMAVHASPLVTGDWQGDDGGGFTWHVHVAPMSSTTVRPLNAVSLRGSASFPLTLYAVTVWIAWRDGNRAHEVRLDTEQIGQGAR
jgi:general secretion pathway protein I